MVLSIPLLRILFNYLFITSSVVKCMAESKQDEIFALLITIHFCAVLCVVKTKSLSYCVSQLVFVTDVNVREDDERIDRAFSYATKNLSIKVEKNAVNSSDTADQQVKLNFADFFIKLQYINLAVFYDISMFCSGCHSLWHVYVVVVVLDR